MRGLFFVEDLALFLALLVIIIIDNSEVISMYDFRYYDKLCLNIENKIIPRMHFLIKNTSIG